MGRGEYGTCLRGEFNGKPVAIKITAPEKAEVEFFKTFLKEVKIMAYIGEHENIIGFMGAVIDKIQNRKLIISKLYDCALVPTTLKLL